MNRLICAHLKPARLVHGRKMKDRFCKICNKFVGYYSGLIWRTTFIRNGLERREK